MGDKKPPLLERRAMIPDPGWSAYLIRLREIKVEKPKWWEWILSLFGYQRVYRITYHFDLDSKEKHYDLPGLRESTE